MMMMMLGIVVALVAVSGVHGFLPTSARTRLSMRMMGPGEVDSTLTSVKTNEMIATRKSFVPVAIAAAFLSPFFNQLAVQADEGVEVKVEEPKVVLGPPPADYGLDYKDFYADCTKIVGHMRYAVQMEKGNPRLAEIATKTKEEMLDFVSYYRRFQGINGKQSYSLLYTSINVLSGHYTSYGVKFPVPEKRRKRLMQEFIDIEKNIRKKR